MADTVYRLQKLTKRYGSREVCRIDSLEIRRGEILGVIGPNGAGKTTLLRLLGFVEPQTSGKISFNGCHIGGAARLPLQERRKITMLFQEPLLLSATVRDNVRFGLRVRGDNDARGLVDETLNMVGLGHLAKAHASTLSAGEAQRVALARSLIIRPEVLLLDEPTANLDPYNVALIEGLIAAINRERGTTIVLVTHNIFQARRLSHRVLLLLEGQVVEVGSTEQMFSNPRDPRTLDFVRGEMIY